MATAILNAVTLLVGSVTQKDQHGFFFWMPGTPAVQLAEYGSDSVPLTDAVDQLVRDPSSLDELIEGRSGRALVYQCVRALTLAAGYRSHAILARVQLRDISGDAEVTREMEKYRQWSTGREPELETFLLGGVRDNVRARYRSMIDADCGIDERLEYLLDEHPFAKNAVIGSWGLIHAKRISDWADQHGQRTPMLDPAAYARSVAKVSMLDQLTRGLLPLAKGGQS